MIYYFLTDTIDAIFAIEPPINVNLLHQFLVMVQYYWDIMSLIDLVGEAGTTKAHKSRTGKLFVWRSEHNTTMLHDVMIAYPDINKVIDMYSDASIRQ